MLLLVVGICWFSGRQNVLRNKVAPNLVNSKPMSRDLFQIRDTKISATFECNGDISNRVSVQKEKKRIMSIMG